MQAWQLAAPGTIEETLKLIDNAAKPALPLHKGQILVEVVSAGLNPADYKTVEMGFFSRAILSFPKTPGMDLSGRVVATADDVEDVKAGDVVLVRLDPTKAPGALSQYVVAERDGYAVLPADFDLDVAAGAPTTAMTAYQTIKPYVEKGSKIFINGGSGGVGTFGIQIGKALGCHVAVSCSTKKKELCEKLGADEIFDYKAGDLVTQLKQSGQVFDLIVDNVGSSLPGLYQQSKHYLKSGGAYVLVGGSASLSSIKGVTMAKFVPSFLGGGRNKLVTYMTSNNHDDLAQIAQWLGEGAIKTIIDATFEFDEAAQAYAHLKKGSSGGKVIVHVSKKT
ncbi:NAD(P)-binding protein [Trichoderma citrinoviride]|uniref:NAD(P)-binding protein n=1 Tax=Trichoderma citrinoviride TaxID=58853 RepID=A0A2T4BGS5_9HYPO|nr:NAD(P)-binding protein [Trichoderma citrinoviride]PTB68468.1 NAD(P)-binding protein [Trichoderma citrinoviride]